MLRVHLSVNTKNGRAMYRDQWRFLGVFASMEEILAKLGDIINFCSIERAR